MQEYSEPAVLEGFNAMCYDPRRYKKMSEQKQFRIVVTVQPDLVVDIQGPEPCDVLAVSGAVVQQLRMMGLEPKAQVMP
jgi:hypothetical protein